MLSLEWTNGWIQLRNKATIWECLFWTYKVNILSCLDDGSSSSFDRIEIHNKSQTKRRRNVKIETQVIEVIDGREVTQIRLINDQGTIASILTLGATWQELLLPQNDGRLKNVVLGHDKPSDYLKNGICAGQTIGRVAGRIKDGQVTIEGERYHLPKNNNGNCLHGGPSGFHRQNWSYTLQPEEDAVGVILTYEAKESEDCFPGDMMVRAHYRLDNQNRLYVVYTGFKASKPTLFNPTNHVYFNLSECDDLSGHTLFIAADQILKTDDQLIPLGDYFDVADTAYDFRRAKPLLPVVQATGGLDDAFVLSCGLKQPIAILADEESGDQVSVYSDRNALVVYSFNFPEEGVVFSRSGGRQNRQHEGVALEAQTLPDAINHTGFGNILLQPDQSISYEIVYSFTCVKK